MFALEIEKEMLKIVCTSANFSTRLIILPVTPFIHWWARSSMSRTISSPEILSSYPCLKAICDKAKSQPQMFSVWVTPPLIASLKAFVNLIGKFESLFKLQDLQERQAYSQILSLFISLIWSLYWTNKQRTVLHCTNLIHYCIILIHLANGIWLGNCPKPTLGDKVNKIDRKSGSTGN